ncbi:UDP-N-acetylmuramyl pentapeptide phosphotransferase [Desulfobacula sp.]|uniref:UDP-N-acetylmuramyl pentapeptide phosphotransferase n=1 Tax=Desulfobacula sp. TaxID=2593537 RepID=UPI0025B7E0EA|nr:UDP-N-acetylmuramyl pentapeptide phosphotransferase [Desulfobacula sp.]MBC2704175.1 UDP-N-acetylmuramyl pentapeptide phosphotransferase [Desulfobacula sp.]
MNYLIVYIASLALGSAGAWLIVRWGSGFGLLDKASNRSSHKGVVPKGGGIGILAAFLLASWVLGLPILFWMCAGLISLLSLYGDRREIAPKIRLGIQLLASIGLLSGLFYWEGRGWPVYLLIPFFAVFVAGTANYYNFMDGINGIAGITGMIAFGLMALFVVLSGGADSFIVLSGCMGLACMGFLPFNMPKARVFMGDVGSIMLGFVYAGLVVGLSYSLNDFMVLCAFLFPFYADELTTLYVRIKDDFPLIKVDKLMKPHRRHFYQLLANEMGVAHWKVSTGYGVLQVLVGIGALVLRGYGNLAVVIFLGCCFAGFGFVSFFARRHKN